MIKKHKKLFVALAIIFALILSILIAFFVYVSDYSKADNVAISALESSEEINVEVSDSMVVFKPQEAKKGLIFYPGGKVEHTAYAPILHRLAEQNILCVLVKMPFNLAVFDINAADGIKEQFDNIDSWYIGGHSLGGSMVASYVAKHTNEFDGLILLASYSTVDLSESRLNVISIYGSNDGVLNMESYEKYRSNLPKDINELVIEGGCHAYFGSYGAQKGDGNPSITSDEQLNQATEYIVKSVGLSPTLLCYSII